jgi:CSLREA domain-containing protein
MRLDAATFHVDTTADFGDAAIGDGNCAGVGEGAPCSLRAAIEEANALAGADVVELLAGQYALTLAGTGDNVAASGDLDITEDVVIRGAGEMSTFIDGAALDRVFDIRDSVQAVSLHVEDLAVRNGRSDVWEDAQGGCIFVAANSELTLLRVTIGSCVADRDGAGIYNNGHVTGEAVRLIDNAAVGGLNGHTQGGAVANIGPGASLELRDCLIAGNVASSGGGVYTSTSHDGTRASVRLDTCSLIDNEVLQLGGALFANMASDVAIVNSTFSGNRAGSGGAIFNDGGCYIDIRNSTIVENHAGNIGGGISEVHFDPKFITLSNTILAGNTADFLGPDCDKELQSNGGTLIGDLTDCDAVLVPGDLADIDPLLGPLTSMGPRAAVHVPLPGSPVIDAGANSECTEHDQLGELRPQDGDLDGDAVCDMGAIEVRSDRVFADGFEALPEPLTPR